MSYLSGIGRFRLPTQTFHHQKRVHKYWRGSAILPQCGWQAEAPAPLFAKTAAALRPSGPALSLCGRCGRQ